MAVKEGCEDFSLSPGIPRIRVSFPRKILPFILNHNRFYFPGLLVGPYLDFVDYLDLVHDKSFQGQDVKGKNGRNLPPGRKRVAYRKMVKGLLWLGFFILFGPNYTFSAALRPEFLAKSFWMRSVQNWARSQSHSHAYVGSLSSRRMV